MEIYQVMKIVASLLLVWFLGLVLYAYNALVTKPEKLRSIMRKQGINGPSPTILFGNTLQIMKYRKNAKKKPYICGQVPANHNCINSVLPFIEEWQKKYGKIFMFSLGNTQILNVTQVDLIKETTMCTSLDWGKPTYQVKERGSLLGTGIITANGNHWAYQRKVIAPEFYMDKVKGMTNLIQESALSLVKSWKKKIEAEKDIIDIKIDPYLRSFSGDVISKACFGSNYLEGEEIFVRLRALEEVCTKRFLFSGIPGMRYLPTKSNREMWALEKETRTLILKLVKERKKTGYEKDLLQTILEGAENSNLNSDEIDQFIVDNCKNIYLAGFETTAVSATWCLMLLAAYPNWQEKVRSEVQEICKGQIPDSDMIRHMKLLTMLINESLRLYSTVPILAREAFKDMEFGNVKIPKGMNVWTMVMALHTDPEIWGQDSYEFNPERFANGISNSCKVPHVFMPFGVGPRVCAGLPLALAELKILISLIVSNFTFRLSPTYVHSPKLGIVIEPQYGVDISLKKLETTR
ncbi:cytochrome P450 714C2-like [Nicotiana tomentosiformis]|nr:cytochrome P450 714C2-like [Nicotiana tomentosiformis]